MLNVGVVQAVFRLNDQFTAGLNLIETRLRAFSQLGSRIGAGFMAAGAAMTAGITAPMTGLIKITSDFETAFANVIKTVDGLDVDSFGKLNAAAAGLREEIRGLARELPVAHTELARIAAVGGQFGVAKDQLVDFTEVVARLGVSIDGIDADTAAGTLAQIQKIAKPTEENAFERMASTLVDLGNKGTSTESTILELTRRISGAAATVNVATQDMFGLAAATANLGHEAELGGTAISRTFLEISRAVAEGGADLNAFAKVVGVSAQEFKEAWGKDAMGTLMQLIEALGKIEKSQLPTVMARLFGKDIRQSQVLTTLIQDFQGLTKTMGDARKEWDAHQALAEESRKKFATFDNQLQLMKNQLYDVAITIGGPVLAALRTTMDEMEPFIDKFRDLAEKFEQLDPKVQATAVSVTLFAAAVGPVLAALGTMVWGITQLGISVAGLMTALKVAAITAFVAALGYLVYQFLEASGAIELAIKWGTAFGHALKDLWDLIGRNNLEALWTILKDVWAIFVDLYEIWTIILQPLMDLLGHQNLLSFAMEVFKATVGAVVLQMTAWLDIIRAVTDTVKTGVEWLEKWVRLLFQIRDIPMPDLPPRPDTPFNRPRSFQSDVAMGNLRAEGGMRDFNQFLAYNTALNQVGATMDFGRQVAIEMAKPENAMRRYIELADGAGKGTKKLSEAQKIAAEQARNLARAQEEQNEAFLDAMGGDSVTKALSMIGVFQQAQKAGLTMPREFMLEMADEIQGAMGTLARLKIPIPDLLREMSQELQLTTYDLNRLEGVATKIDFKEMIQGIEQADDNLREFNKDLRAAQWDVIIEAQTDKAVKKVFEVVKAWDGAMDKFRKPPPLGVTLDKWRQLATTVEQGYANQLEQVIMDTEEWKRLMVELSTVLPGMLGMIPPSEEDAKRLKKAKVDTDTFAEAIGKLSTAFNQLNDLHPLEGWVKDMARLVALMSVGVSTGQALRLALTRPSGARDEHGDLLTDEQGKPLREFQFDTLMGQGLSAGVKGLAEFATAWINVAAAAMQAYAAMQQATDVAGKGNRIFQGAMTGAAIGSQIHPVYGTIIGFFVGAIWGAVRKVPWEQIGKRIGMRLGVSISEELSRAIEQTANTRFSGNWQAAEIFHIGDVIQEAGGLNKLNFGLMARELRDVFSMLETGMFNSAEASKVLNDNWAEFVKVGTDGLGFIDFRLREMVDLAHKFGLEVEAIQEWEKEQAGKVVDAFNVIGEMPASFANYQKIADNIAQARKEIEDLNEETERGTAWAAKMQKAQTMLATALKQQADAAAIATEELNDLGTIGVASVFAAVAAGMSLTQAIQKAGPGLDSLIKAYQNLGMTAEDPLVAIILRQREVQNAIPNVINGVDALGESLVGLTNLGLLNADSFGAIQRTAFRAYTTIQGEIAKVGGTTRDALLPMQTYLHQAERAAKELGIPLDENTQMMIDQSKELGIWKELGPTAAEKTEAAMMGLTTAIENLTKALLGIPNEIPDPTRNWRPPGAPTVPKPNPDDPDDPGRNQDPSRAVGSRAATGRWFEQWDPSQPVKLHGVEAVIRPDQASAFAADVLGSMSQEPYQVSSGEDSQPIFLVLPDRRVLAQVVVEDMPDELRRRGIRSLSTI